MQKAAFRKQFVKQGPAQHLRWRSPRAISKTVALAQGFGLASGVKGSQFRILLSALVSLLPLLPVGAREDEPARLQLGVAQDEEAWESTGWTPVQLSLFRPVQVFDDGRDVYGLRLNLLYGRNRNLVGLDLGLVNSTRNFGGIQAGLWNESHLAAGFQFGLLGNVARGSGEIDPEVYKRYENAERLIGSYKNFGKVGEALRRLSRLSLVLSPLVLGRADAYGAQLSAGFNSAGDLVGLQCCGLFNSATGNVVGLQAGILYNFAQDVYGFQIGPLGLNRSRDLYGIQFKLLGANLATGRSVGLQLSILGNTAAELYGMQLGFFNLGGGAGLQLGLVNFGQPFGGIQAGLLNRGGATGISLGFINQHTIQVTGLAAALSNSGGGPLRGAQLALSDNYTSRAYGLQLAVGWNRNATQMTGVQVAGLFNRTEELRGFQLAAINIASQASGAQVGVFNYADELDGIQFGLINIHRKGIPFLPIVNWGSRKAAPEKGPAQAKEQPKSTE